MSGVKMREGRRLFRGLMVAMAVTSVAAVAACGGPKQDDASASPAAVTSATPTPTSQPLNDTRAAAALATGGIGVGELPGMRPLGAPVTRLDSPTLGGLCGTADAGMSSEKLRMARRQLVWSAGRDEFVSEERVVYQQGGVQAALKDLQRAATTVCPDRIGVAAAPASAKLPAGSMAFSSKDAKQGGPGMDSYAVPVGNQLLVVLWSNWTMSPEPVAIRTALAKARAVVVQREKPTLQALAG
ncbi:hypothetical protein OHA18_00560 [Kribbella sp. NBC_00709]|uniref:hypothetical protein n=1 Tax=Kribbella sp. NBC_00709 TaxID=2975972 RepID=UPI002E2CF547|nr:hypothetical protein [Kribbella sp. NBC_00709]